MGRIEHIGDATLYLGDSLEILPTLGQVDATVEEESILINVTNELAMEWGINLEEIES